MSRAVVGIPGKDFEAARARGDNAQRGSTEDLGRVLDLIQRLRRAEHIGK
jgi:hypothetical protein